LTQPREREVELLLASLATPFLDLEKTHHFFLQN